MALDGAQVLVLVPVDDGSGATEYIPVAEQTSLSMENTHNLIDASSKDNTHTKWLYGKEDNTLSLEALYVPGDKALKALKDAKKNREKVILRRSEEGTEVEEAEALIETISYEWPDNDNSTVSVDFQLNEAWQEVTS